MIQQTMNEKAVYLITETKDRSKITVKWLQMFNFSDGVPDRVTNFIGLVMWTFYCIKLWFTIDLTWVFIIKFAWSSTATISGYFVLKLVGKAADDFYKDIKPPVIHFVKTKLKILGKEKKPKKRITTLNKNNFNKPK